MLAFVRMTDKSRRMNRPRTRDTDPGAVAGRERLLDAAEELFDQQGIDGPSARAIAAAAGHKNTAAVWYHFGDRAGLMQAVGERWAIALEARRTEIIDALEAAGETDRRAYMRAIVQPWVEIMPTAQGRRRMRLIGQLVHHPTYSAMARLDFVPSTGRAVAHLLASGSHLEPARRAHRAQTALRLVMSSLAMQATLLDEDPPRRIPLDSDDFLEDLLTITLAVLDAPDVH